MPGSRRGAPEGNGQPLRYKTGTAWVSTRRAADRSVPHVIAVPPDAHGPLDTTHSDTPFQLVFSETSLKGGLMLDVGRTDDPTWQAAARRVLDLVAGRHGGPASEEAAWQELLAWFQVDQSLAGFLQRAFQALDAAAWLLGESLDDVAEARVATEPVEVGSLVHSLQVRVDRLQTADEHF